MSYVEPAMLSLEPEPSSFEPVTSSGEAGPVTEATDASKFDPQCRSFSDSGSQSISFLPSHRTFFVRKTGGGVVSLGSGGARPDVIRRQVALPEVEDSGAIASITAGEECGGEVDNDDGADRDDSGDFSRMDVEPEVELVDTGAARVASCHSLPVPVVVGFIVGTVKPSTRRPAITRRMTVLA